MQMIIRARGPEKTHIPCIPRMAPYNVRAQTLELKVMYSVVGALRSTSVWCYVLEASTELVIDWCVRHLLLIITIIIRLRRPWPQNTSPQNKPIPIIGLIVVISSHHVNKHWKWLKFINLWLKIL